MISYRCANVNKSCRVLRFLRDAKKREIMPVLFCVFCLPCQLFSGDIFYIKIESTAIVRSYFHKLPLLRCAQPAESLSNGKLKAYNFVSLSEFLLWLCFPLSSSWWQSILLCIGY